MHLPSASKISYKYKKRLWALFFIILQMRIKSAFRVAGLHFIASVLVVAAIAAVIFLVWYPRPFYDIQGGKDLFFLMVVIDIICGPILTLVIWKSSKTRSELARDMAVIVLIQISALTYGVYALAKSRPVYIAFEGNRFRVVSMADIDFSKMSLTSQDIPKLSWSGPKPIGVKIYQGTDPNFMNSVRDALNGIHPAYQPDRWIPYRDVDIQLKKSGKPLLNLLKEKEQINQFLKGGSKLDISGIIYIPLVGFNDVDWVVLLNKNTTEIVGYMQINGW
ncbi:hypothetical protein M2375_002684 [Comamonas sp. BIGb0152]|uniref:TfpX/TfpZ family type IV pilin accessory protein n=1 Tax=Comamonas sp. BIGb0152 TaxID=2940601 RepID=UPI0021673FFD|nr:TfpX/TfpZ family type IV pilin accessory protein [Comamonas sp. BIGb0152]MCS4294451.1 hypothetical protein [Comamonas sp. BIGb0152]